MADWDANSPADDDIVSAFPANERAARAAAKTAFGVDHHDEDDANQGYHEYLTMQDRDGAVPTGVADKITIWHEDGEMKARIGTGTAGPLNVIPGAGEFPADTKLLFPQATAPTGWTQDTDVNDKVIRVVDDSGTGAATGGDWEISGVTVTVAGHALTVSEMPAHAHPGSVLRAGATGNDGGAGSDRSDISVSLSTGVIIASQGGGQAHGHTGSTISADGEWRPAYLDVIKATKD